MSPRRSTGRAIAYHAGDIPASLLTLSEIAASLATAESLDDVLPGILGHVCAALGHDVARLIAQNGRDAWMPRAVTSR